MKNSINLKTDFKIDKRIAKYIGLFLILLMCDQLVKILTYNNLNIHQEINVMGDWFRIRLELNDGTAYAVPFKNETDRYIKILLKSLSAMALAGCLIYFINKKSPTVLLIGLTLCTAGTTGNLIDRVFHGVLLHNSLDAYGIEWFHGRVIDMIYMPMVDTNWPSWIPFVGGERFVFFEPVYNLADLVLFTGGILSFIGLLKIRSLAHIKNQLN